MPIKFKGSIQVESDLTLSSSTANRALVSDGSKNIVHSAVTATELGYVSGVTSAVQTQFTGKQSTSEKGVANGYASLDGGGKVPIAQLPNSIMEFQGNWNATTNTPTLADGTGNTGDVYRVNVAGTQDLGSGSQTFVVGDFVMYGAGGIWEKAHAGADAVLSVNGSTGVVVVNAINQLTGDVTTSAASGSQSLAATIANGAVTDAKVASGIDAVKIGSGAVSNTEFGYLDGVTSAIQTQLDGKAAAVAGDISQTSFSAADGQATPANVTGLAFANGVVRSFEAMVSVYIDATASLYESFKLYGIQKGASWDLQYSSIGDNSTVVFTITNAGQIQYVSTAAAGFVSNTIKFRASVLGV
jgi:hypothetical protein